MVNASAESYNHDRHSIAWVSSLIQHHQALSKNLSFTLDVKIESFAEALVTFQYSLENRPDGAVMHSYVSL